MYLYFIVSLMDKQGIFPFPVLSDMSHRECFLIIQEAVLMFWQILLWSSLNLFLGCSSMRHEESSRVYFCAVIIRICRLLTTKMNADLKKTGTVLSMKIGYTKPTSSVSFRIVYMNSDTAYRRRF
jgi:hypothetical protein